MPQFFRLMRMGKLFAILLSAILLINPAVNGAPGGSMFVDSPGAAARSEKSFGEVSSKLHSFAQALVKAGATQEDAACFLMRVAFTCYAEDLGLIQKGSFQRILTANKTTPERCAPAITALWKTMKGCGGGWLFETPEALPLDQKQVALLAEVTAADWEPVNVTIFGNILEYALEPTERQQLGTHYTPASYVERLVQPTILEPLKKEWAAVDKTNPQAVLAFHERLCKIVVLDPACGSGNFLATSFELLSAFDNEVVATLRKLRQPEPTSAIGIQQFRGIEIAPHSADVCELVLRVTWLKAYMKTHRGLPPEIDNQRVVDCKDALLAYDSTQKTTTAKGEPDTRYLNPRPAEWPSCDYVVGNPPFLGNAKMRRTLGDGYVEAVRGTYKAVPGKCDYVMYWWYKSAELLRQGKIQRFGLITTSSIRSKFNSRVVEQFLDGQPPLSVVYAIPDHPWGAGVAQTRIAMTVCAAGEQPGTLATVTDERLSTNGYNVELKPQVGSITPRLTLGADLNKAKELRANDGLCTRGVMLSGSGFIVTEQQAKELGLGSVPGLEEHIREYLNGRDVNMKSRDVMVIDMTGLGEAEVKQKFPKVYAHLAEQLKAQRAGNNNQQLQENWWLFGGQKPELRKMLNGLNRYIVTVETAKNQCFVFLDKEVLPDNTLVVIGSDDALLLGVLSSKVHREWILAAGGRKGKAPVYSKTTTFDTFPFPTPNPAQAARIRDLAERLDALRKERQKLDPDLTLSGMYSVLQKMRADERLTEREQAISKAGKLKDLLKLHDELDAAVLDAYGWPADIDSSEIVDRLFALNQQRATEEAKGKVSWLRPQIQLQTGAKP